jgi:hypothetical protein
MRRTGSGFLHDFVMQFDHRFPEHVQHGRAAGRQVIVTPAPLPFSNSGFRLQPSVALETFQEWIEGAGTDVVSVTAQLGEHPLADDGMLGGVMQDVHLPEPQQDLSRQEFGVRGGHEGSPPVITTIDVNEYQSKGDLQGLDRSR